MNRALLAILWAQIVSTFHDSLTFLNRTPHSARVAADGFAGLDFQVENLENRQLLAGVIVDNASDVVDNDTSSISALIADADAGDVSLREALLAANNTAGADTISFEAGATFNISLTSGELQIGDAVTIDGTDAFDVTIDGGGSTVVNANASTVLRSVTVTNGDRGVQSTADLTIDSSIVSNSAGYGIYVDSSFSHRSLTITNSTISGNGGDFSSVYINGDAEVSIQDSVISGNSSGISAQLDSFYDYNSVEISNSQITNNGGGGIRTNVDLVVDNSNISGNSGNYGGIHVTGYYGYGDDQVLIRNSTISNNSSGYAAVHVSGNETTVINSTISDNSSFEYAGYSYGGGGLYLGGNATLINTTISGNNNAGGGFFFGGGLASGYASNELNVINSTITANSSNYDGSGIYVVQGTTLQLTNSIVTGNNSSQGSDDDIYIDTYGYQPVFSGNNIVGSSFDISGYSNVEHGEASDIFDGGLSDHGGPVQTIALAVGSAAIDTGDSSLLPTDEFDLDGDGDLTEVLPVDARGAERVAGGDVDLGAYELVNVFTVDTTMVTVDEGETAINGGSIDVNAILTASTGTVTNNGDGTWSWSLNAADGPATEIVTITDTLTQQSESFDLVVSNVDPVISVDATAVTVDEGDTATNSGSISDVPADVLTLSASIGTVTDNGDGTWSWNLNTTDGPDDSASVTITATDDDGGTASTSFNLQVNNVSPTVTVASTFLSVDEGEVAVNSGTYSDPGNDVITLIASHGTIVDNGDGTWSWSRDTTSPLDSAPVSISAFDDDGGFGSADFTLIVNNLDPTISANSSLVTVDEGVTATNSGVFADAGSGAVTLSASAGAVTDNGDGTWSWSINTADGPDDSASVTITASDEHGGSASTSFNLEVDNLAPLVSVDNATVDVDEGNDATNSGTFGDLGTDAVTLSATVGTITDNLDGTWDWALANALVGDSQTVTVTAVDSDNASTSTTFDLNVTGEALTLVSLSTPSISNVGNDGSFEVAATGSGTLTYEWDFGDGSAIQTGSVVSHAFDSAGDFSGTVTISDGAGNTLVETFSVEVTDITIRVRNNRLTLNGTTDDDFVEVISDGSTILVNGVDTGVAADSLEQLRISTRGGVDEVRLGGGVETLVVDGTLRISTGGDDDVVTVDNVEVVDTSRITAGGGDDVVTIGNSTFVERLTVATGGGDDLLNHDFATINYVSTFLLNGGGGFDLITEFTTEPDNGTIRFDGFIV